MAPATSSSLIWAAPEFLQWKNLFNATHPRDDLLNGLLVYPDKPTVPEILENLFPGVQAPNNIPRFDMFWIFNKHRMMCRSSHSRYHQ